MDIPTSSTADRKTIERNRRIQMKGLYSQLDSLLPHHASREAASLPDKLDEASKYIKKLQMKVERMKERKANLMRTVGNDGDSNANTSTSDEAARWKQAPSLPPQIGIQEMGCGDLEVVLATGLENHESLFTGTVRILHEEGAEILNASFSVVDDRVFHTIHSKVGESSMGYGVAATSERLKKFVQDAHDNAI